MFFKGRETLSRFMLNTGYSLNCENFFSIANLGVPPVKIYFPWKNMFCSLLKETFEGRAV